MTSAEIRVLSFEEAISRLRLRPRPYAASYRAMYSSCLGGIVLDAALMSVPIDDHVVHRGDGVFEAMKLTNGRIYGLDRHLKRLERSAGLAQLTIPGGLSALRSIVLQTARAVGDLRSGLIRLYLTRGPGGFSANPYESTGPEVYVVITNLASVPAVKYEAGASCITSSIPAKAGWFATVKSCNYLHNVLMKKEAVDAGVDFAVSLDERGLLAEGSTENCAIVTKLGLLLTPCFDRVLRGITAVRCLELAESLLTGQRGSSAGLLSGIQEGDLSRQEALEAREMFFFGTTIDVVPVVLYDGHAIGNGRPGPVFAQLQALLQGDIHSNEAMSTEIEGAILD